ncbi:MAG: hypothetical protein NTY47_01385, partial [Candidatus Omnitrophica bacterium]|nr:hypothetical protein [Candidatus Omnitrophota bacterium]
MYPYYFIDKLEIIAAANFLWFLFRISQLKNGLKFFLTSRNLDKEINTVLKDLSVEDIGKFDDCKDAFLSGEQITAFGISYKLNNEDDVFIDLAPAASARTRPGQTTPTQIEVLNAFKKVNIEDFAVV